MRVAALDFGSNSFLCLVAELNSDGQIQTLSDQVEIVRLGKNVDFTKQFSLESINKADQVMQSFRLEIDRFKPSKILAVATAAARKVQDPSPLFNLAAAYKIPIKIISGTEEARLTFVGGTIDYKDNSESLLVIDIGGGSTELVLGHRGAISKSLSTPLGCVNLTEKFFLNSEKKASSTEVEFYLQQVLGPAALDVLKQTDQFKIIAVAGTPTELVKQSLGRFDQQKINGFEISSQFLGDKLSHISDKTSDELTAMGFSRNRSDVILAGTYILNFLIKALGKEKIKVSTKGLRYGVALDLFNSI
jgi:exopolyphosphatase/guanosine-5'-triphosphate,3'-diphosphate pyrophosphatase